MKKRTLIMSLVLSLALIAGSMMTAFAAYPENGIETVQKITNEVTAEKFCYNFVDEVATGGYGLVDTEQLKAIVDAKEDVVIVDTMPEGWWKQHHVPGAINAVAGDWGQGVPKKSFEEFDEAEQKALLEKVKKAVGTKSVTKYKNKKTKKVITKAKYKKLSKKNKKNYKKVTVKQVNKDKTVIVYCGFVGCARSHQAGMFLVKEGFKNVYRYAGGISAWVDAGYDVEAAQ